MRYYWRFREQDGSWTDWEECTYDQYRRHKDNPDVDLMAIPG